MSERQEWNDQKVESLRKLVTEGMSATEMAKRLGTTRNAILGKIHRLNICSPTSRGRGRPVKQAAEELKSQIARLNALGIDYATTARRLGVSPKKVQHVAKSIGLSRVVQVNEGRGGRTKAIKRPDVPRHSLSSPEAVAQLFREGHLGQRARVTLLGLEYGMCKFPIDIPDGETRYCGDVAEEGGSYCPHHAARCGNGYGKPSVTQARRMWK